MTPPNQNYKISPVTHVPEYMQHDFSILPPGGNRCPLDGNPLARIGSNGNLTIRCPQCGHRYGLYAP